MDASIWPFLACAFGLSFVVAEVFLPTSGLLWIPAFGFLGIGVYLAFLHSQERGVWFLISEGILVPSTLSLSILLFSRTLGRSGRMSLEPPEDGDHEVAHGGRELDGLIGRPGRALTPLRPSGMVDFDGRRLDGLSESGLISRGATVFAVRVRSGRVVVREVSPDSGESFSAEVR